jgi:hypothetical protein
MLDATPCVVSFYGHFDLRSRTCGHTVSVCRCLVPEKPVKYTEALCSDCAAAQTRQCTTCGLPRAVAYRNDALGTVEFEHGYCRAKRLRP